MRNKYLIRISVLVIVLALVAAACASTDQEMPVTVETTTTTTESIPLQITPTTAQTTTTVSAGEEPTPLEGVTTTTVSQGSNETEATITETMVSRGDVESEDPTSEEPSTTTVSDVNPTDVCEAPDTELTLDEQQWTCAGFLWGWLEQFNSDMNGLYVFGLDTSTVNDSTTLTIFISALDGTDEAILATQTERVRLGTYPVPEEWLAEEQIMEMDALASSKAAKIQEDREGWFSLIAFVFASYANLLDLDSIVLEIAYLDPEVEGGWVRVNFTATPETIMAEVPGTLGGLYLAIIEEDEQANQTYWLGISKIFGVFDKTAVNADGSADTSKPSTDD